LYDYFVNIVTADPFRELPVHALGVDTLQGRWGAHGSTEIVQRPP